jgi:antitoxin PrlF
LIGDAFLRLLILGHPYYKVRFLNQGNTMAAATVTSKGQITIPVEVRKALGVGTGDRIEFIEIDRGRYEIVPATGSIMALKGVFGKPKQPVTIEEMNAAIARRGAGRK